MILIAECIVCYHENIYVEQDVYYFFDEIQYAQDWDKWLKTIYDMQPDTQVVATGSASLPCVHPIDTTGAGDIFGGSAVSRLLELEKPIDALTEADLAYIGCFAATAASLSTEASGGIPSIPEKDAVLKAM